MNLTTDYPLEVVTKMRSLKKNMNKDEYLREHQYLFLKYITEVSYLKRGILAFHGTGTGKTITAEGVVDYYRRMEPDRDVVLLMSKSLTNNFKDTVKTYMENNPYANVEEKKEEYIKKTIDAFKFITLGSSNMYSQFEKIDKEYDTILKGFMDNEKILENKILIIDEVHNLCNSIVNGSSNAIKLYDLIMNTTNIRLIFLTATPMINTPFELVPLMNMLRGYMDGGNTLLPENYGDFMNMFVKDKNISNKQKLMNRLYGLVSYYGAEYLSLKNKDYPQQQPTILEKIPMSEYQFTQYENMRIIEKKEDTNKMAKATTSDRFADKSGASSSYRVKSRQISNFAYPEDTFSFINGKFKKMPEKITDEHLKKLKEYSPKMAKLLKNIEGPGPDVIYSQFLPTQLQRILVLKNYELWTMGGPMKNEEDVVMGGYVVAQGGGTKKKKFAIISGEVSQDMRAEIVKSWNSIENIRGEVIKLMIITATGAEGLDLKYGRRVHILEPFWNMARVEQVIARIVRFRSHSDLPAAEQNVQPYIYLSDYPKNYPKNKIKETTTDINLYTNAVNAKNLINEFIKVLIEVSVDCEVLITPEARKKFKCMICNPTHALLYHPDINVDRKLPNRCSMFSEIKRKVEEINLPELGEKYYFNQDDGELRFYKFNVELNGYIPLIKNDPHYVELTRHVLSKK